jgi:hypothetical protein
MENNAARCNSQVTEITLDPRNPKTVKQDGNGRDLMLEEMS